VLLLLLLLVRCCKSGADCVLCSALLGEMSVQLCCSAISCKQRSSRCVIDYCCFYDVI
jgi:hypothetical protein